MSHDYHRSPATESESENLRATCQSHSHSDCHSHDEDEKTAFEEETTPVSQRDLRPVVRKLQVLLGEALAEANQSGVNLTVDSLVQVVEEALREASDMGYRAGFPATVEGIFLSGIYDDLVQQPSNIFDVVTRSNGKTYYVPLSSGVWIRCLESLKALLREKG